MLSKRNKRRKKKGCNKKKIKRPHGTMRGLKLFEYHDYGLQVRN
jgi:hypothetical protein